MHVFREGGEPGRIGGGRGQEEMGREGEGMKSKRSKRAGSNTMRERFKMYSQNKPSVTKTPPRY